MKVTITVIVTALFTTLFVLLNMYEYHLPWWIPEPVTYALYGAFVLFSTRSIPTTVTATVFLFILAYHGMDSIISELSIETTALSIIAVFGLGLSRIGPARFGRCLQRLSEEADRAHEEDRRYLRELARVDRRLSRLLAGLDTDASKPIDPVVGWVSKLLRQGDSYKRK